MSLTFVLFLNCASIGIITGFVSDISYFMKKMFKMNYIVNLIVDFCIFFIGASFIFVYSCEIINGVFALYEILAFVIGVSLEKISCSNLFAKFFDMVYNRIIRVKNKLKQTKFGKLIFR